MVRLRRANESGCTLSAGSSDAGAARRAMWSTPPYCGRVSAPAVRAHTIKLLTASDRQSKSLIASCLPIPRYRDCRVALRLRPQRSDAAGKIDSGAHRDGIAIWKFVGAHGIPVFFSACGQYLPACAARSLYARQVAAPVESGGLVVHSVHHMHASILHGEDPQQISFALITDENFQSLPEPFRVARYGYSPNQVVLTFDDGPDPEWTPKILDVLKREHAPATFFLIGIQTDDFSGLAKRIYNEGHTIGNHTR